MDGDSKPLHRQGLPRAVRDAHPQAHRRHPRPQPARRRRAHAPLAPRGREHRDQVLMKGLLAKKLGMTQLFNQDGTTTAVTVLEAGPCKVLGLRTNEKDGYSAARIAFGPVKEDRLTSPLRGVFKSANIDARRHVVEIRNYDGLEQGQDLTAEMFKAGEVVDVTGTSKGKGFQGPVKHQAYLRQLANARQGTASTKTRATVRGGGAKPYRQKGTGRARHGSIREPSMVGGATVFGPQPRSFAQRMPRKMRRLALRSALSIKANERRVSVLEGFAAEEPSTSKMGELLRELGAENTALLVLATPNDIVSRSANNIPWAKVILARNLNLYDLFTFEHLVVAKDALELLEETFAQ